MKQIEFNPSDGTARRAARKAGLVAKKTRWRKNTIDNYGGYQLIDAHSNTVVAGVRFDMSAADVVRYCVDLKNKHQQENKE